MSKIELDLSVNEDELRKQFKKDLQLRAQNLLDAKIKLLFHNKHTQGPGWSSYGKADPDTGLMLDLVNATITEVVMDPKWTEYTKQRAEEKFQPMLDDAIDKALTRQANKLAFQQVGVKPE